MFIKHFNQAQQHTSQNFHHSESSLAAIQNLSRRNFLVGAGTFIVGVSLSGSVLSQAKKAALTDAKGGDASPSLWVSIDPDDTVKITCHRAEMGQQVWTSMAQIIADELDAQWSKVEIIQALGHPKYGDQNTDGSRSVRYNFHRLRLAGAAMRRMLEQAAAKQWNTAISNCHAENGYVLRSGSNDKLSYGELSQAASTLPLPLMSEVSLKSRDQWRYIGKPVPSLTVPKIIWGQGTYGIDVNRPGMVIAVVARPPQVFGRTGKFNDEAAKKVPGVLHTVKLPDLGQPALFKALGGIAVVANDTWAAMQGRKALEVEWLDGPNAKYNSKAYRKTLEAESRKPGDVRLNRGETTKVLDAAEKKISADYYVPHLAQSPMEPPAATAEWTGDKLECWACVQDPQTTRSTLASILGIAPENVTVHGTWLGGAFGRKSKPDFVVEAALIAREVGKPVKVCWTREDDIKHGYYHSVSAQHFEGAVNEKGVCTAFLHRTVFPPISSTFVQGSNKASSVELGLGASDNPFDIENLRLESGKADAHVRIGWLRSVANIYHAFGIQSFASELAHAAGKDPKDYLLELIGPDRLIDPTKEGAKDYPNYDASLKEYPIETGRLSHVLRVVAYMAKWGRPLPKGHGLGIAVHRSFLSYVATVVEVGVTPEGELSIPHVWVAIDTGTVVNPRHVTAQMEGGTLYGLSNALYGEITATDGAVDQSNFPDYRVMRMKEAPRKFDVHIVESSAPPCGVGEPATPPSAPALANAIFAATGTRIRNLPMLGLTGQKLSLKA
jgi:isoquinoline 1-oxidoreductase beta subunit